jgi:exopolyphosphatase/guanosine-5'-triphosphate,3'-diphosphate pyrophosphatase
MSRIAIIDLGTNTFNLLIIDVGTDLHFTTVFQTKISVKLGEGGINKGFIAPAPFNRGIEALKTYKTIIDEHHVNEIHAIATSAIRGASNKVEFLAKAKEATCIDIRVISGEKEAEIIYYGVRKAVKLSNENSLIIDIGGGSTEFIIGNSERIVWKQSFLLGVARLLEIFNPSDPITDDEIKECTDYLRKALDPLFEAIKKYPVTELVGSSGSFDSLAEMMAYKYYSPYILKDKTEFTFDLEHYKELHQTILKSTIAERTEMKGLVAMRVDMIVISSILVKFIVDSFNISQMRLSTYSLKEGVLYESLHAL